MNFYWIHEKSEIIEIVDYVMNEKLGVIAIVNRNFPLISNLSVIENLMLVGSYHLSKNIKQLESDIFADLKKFNMDSKIHYRKERLSEFEDFLVRFLQAKHSYFNFVFIIDELTRIDEKNRDEFLDIIDKEENDNLVFIEYNKNKSEFSLHKFVTLGDYKLG